MLRIKRDINQQDLKKVKFYFVKSERNYWRQYLWPSLDLCLSKTIFLDLAQLAAILDFTNNVMAQVVSGHPTISQVHYVQNNNFVGMFPICQMYIYGPSWIFKMAAIKMFFSKYLGI